jgi:glutamyl-tRNA synthetase
LKDGYLPEAVLNFVMFLGWNPGTEKEIYTLDEFVKDFSIEKIQKSEMAAFDRQKLLWMNGLYIRNLPPEYLWKKIEKWSREYLDNFEADFVALDSNMDFNLKVLSLIRERMKRLDEFNDLAYYFYRKPKVEKKFVEKFSGNLNKAHEIINNFSKAYEKISDKDWDVKNLDRISHTLLEEFSYTPKEAFMTIRYVVTGRESTPPLFDVLALLGKEETIERMKKF